MPEAVGQREASALPAAGAGRAGAAVRRISRTGGRTIVRSMEACAAMAPLTGGAHAQGQLPARGGLSYLWGAGPKADPVVTQLYGTIALSLFVVVVVGGLVLYGSLWRRARPEDGRLAGVPLESGGRGLLLIYIGTALSFVALLATLVWGFAVLGQIAGPQRDPAFTVRITGYQWWWKVEYLSPQPHRQFTTANELHIPVGEPVRVELRSADVIHSFWVPALGGKMDLIPTMTNETWIQADSPGTYRGQCSEYCGKQHAHMAFLVTARPAEEFAAWWDDQLQGAPPPPRAFMKHCAVCHTVRGTPAQGRVGPDLSHLAQRRSLAAGTLRNSIGNLSGWISNPQHIKPGSGMPTLTLTTDELQAITAYLSRLD